MKLPAGLLFVVLTSAIVGTGLGKLWLWGNGLAETRFVWFVLMAVLANLLCAVGFYLILRGGAAIARDGVWTVGFFSVVNLFVTLGLGASVSGVIFGGVNAAGVGAHAFSWGVSYTIGQSFVDVRNGVWFAADADD